MAEPAETISNLNTAKISTRIEPLIVGLYGISGSGKSYLLNELSQSPLRHHLDFVDGSALIDKHFGLAEFKKLDPEEQNSKRAELM